MRGAIKCEIYNMNCADKRTDNRPCLYIPTECEEGQLLISNGDGNISCSESLLQDKPAVLSAYLAVSYTMSAGSDVEEPIPATNVVPDFGQSSAEAYLSIFDFNGFNVSGKQIWVMVNYSMTFNGASNSGERAFWLQIVGDPNSIRFGQSEQLGSNAGVIVAGNAVFSLQPGGQAQFWAGKSNAGGNSVIIEGGLEGSPTTSRFQTFLIN